MSLDFDLVGYVDTGSPEGPFRVEIFSRNYTHNVYKMWQVAGCHDALYESHGKLAMEVTEELRKGLDHMQANPAEYLPLNPKNGWGDYNTALDFLREVYLACVKHPKAKIEISA